MRISGIVKLERFDKHNRLLERRVQPMRSWTKNFVDILYVYHTQTAFGSAIAIQGDVDTIPRNFYALPSSNSYWHNLFCGAVVAPGGFEHFSPHGASNIPENHLYGNELGIQIGNGNTLVTPLNTRLARRIGHGIRPADGGDVTFEAYDVGDDQNAAILTNDNTQIACPFVPQHDFRCSSVELKMWKTLAPAGPLKVEIRAMSATRLWTQPHASIGNVLATIDVPSASFGGSPGAFIPCVFGTPIDLYAGRLYFINCHSAGVDGANYFNWRFDNTAPTFNKNYLLSGTTTGNWYLNCIDAWAAAPTTNLNQELMFRAIGRSIGEMEYDACRILNQVTSNPNSSFDIRRMFHNRSGAAITVNEVGITAPAQQYAVSATTILFPALIARDVIGGGVAVADTEILVVTYTPQITV